MGSPVGESGRSRGQGVDGLLREKDRTADGARDHRPGVDADADPKRTLEALGNEALNQHRGRHRGVGIIGEIVLQHNRERDRVNPRALTLVRIRSLKPYTGVRSLACETKPPPATMTGGVSVRLF